MPPHINSVTPNSGDPGDRFNLIILGDVFSRVTACDFGTGVELVSYNIINDGTIAAKVDISKNANPGLRDVVLTDPSGSGTLSIGFEVK
jgi:hypothetical protein